MKTIRRVLGFYVFVITTFVCGVVPVIYVTAFVGWLLGCDPINVDIDKLVVTALLVLFLPLGMPGLLLAARLDAAIAGD